MTAKQKLSIKRLAVILGVLALPLIYSITYLKGFWDPYNNLGDIKVAVVNQDECQADCKSTTLIKKLQDSKSFAFIEKDAESAEKGLHDKEYYATITIPKDFTASFDKAETKERKSTVIKYRPNNKSNYITSQLIHNAVMQVEMSLDQEVAKTVTGKLTNQLNQVPKQVSAIGDGLGIIMNGTAQLETGASKLSSGTNQLQSNYIVFNNGVYGLNNGIIQLAAGTEKLVASSTRIQQGINQLDQGAGQLKSGTQQLKDQTAQLPALANQLPSLISGFNQYKTSSDQAYDYATTAYQLIIAYFEANPSAQSDPQLQNAYGIAKQYIDNNGLAQLKASTNALNQGINQLSGVDQKINALVSAINQLDAGASNLSSGLSSLNGSYQTFHQGILTLNTSTQKLVSGSKTLSNASTQIQSGIGRINSGSDSLQSGTKRLSSGVATAKTELEDKNAETKARLAELEGLDDYAKKPVTIKDDGYGVVDNYGTFFAPFFISLSLWLGGVLILIGLYYDPDNRFQILGRNSNNRTLRFFAYAGLGVAQALILALVLHWSLGFSVTNWPLFFGSCILISLAFLMIIMFLFFNFGDVGKFIAIVLLVVQLAACNGTFPIEVEPNFFSIIAPFMPMKYSVELLRESFVAIEEPLLSKNILVLGTLLVVFAALTITTEVIRSRRSKI